MRFIILAVLAITICSCNNTDKVNFNKPESVVRAFYKAFSEIDFTKMTEYSTEETKPLIDMLSNLLTTVPNVSPNVFKSRIKKMYQDAEDITCTDAGTDMKTCTVCCDSIGEGFNAPVFVKKVNGKWLVHIPKDMPTDGEALPEEPVGK